MTRTVTHQDLKSLWGSEDHLEVAQSRGFASMIFELLSEKTPTDQELKIFELILNLSIDHGPDTPSAQAVIEKAQKGESISESVAEGIKQINDTHGGAVEPLMEILYRIQSAKCKVQNLVTEYLKERRRLPGFGHRIYKDQDPRAQLIIEWVESIGDSGKFVQIVKELGQELSTQTDKQLPLNLDGAIAVALCSFGWEPRLGKVVFIIARTPGLCAHYLNNS